MSSEPAQPPTVHPWVVAGQQRVRFGVLPWSWAGPLDWPAYFRVAAEAEALGFDSFWVPDHPSGARGCWTTLTALAQRTAQLRLGSLVNCVYYRTPVDLARMAADVDQLSNGRLVLGLGLGDSSAEFASMGLRWPPMRERQEVLHETIDITYGLWAGQPFTYHGRHFQVEGAQLQAPPLQQRVPLLIAGGGERRTLRQAARYADVSNFGQHEWLGGATTVADVRRKLQVLRGHCEALGRPYDAILRSHFSVAVLAETKAELQAKLAAIPESLIAFLGTMLLVGTPEQLIESYRALVTAGMQYFVVSLIGADSGTLRLLGEQVMPALQLIPQPA